MKIPCPYSWKKCTFAHKLCENGQSSESQHACMIGRVAPDEGKANGLHLGKERALCTRFAPSLSHAFRKGCRFFCCSISQPNCDLERDFYEQDLYIIGTAHHSAVSNHRCIGAVAGLAENMGRGLRFLYAFELVLSPLDLETKVITK